jgi:3-hydroxyisobutyrate dehydrogenase-like beta-hydroxyacid dehydrogenase
VTVGVIGLGIMGSAMSGMLLKAGFTVVGYDVLAKRRSDHRRAGGRAATRVGEVAAGCDVIITSLPSSKALIDVSEGLGSPRAQARIVIETSTLPIAVKERARRMLRTRGVTLLDCPLSGTGAQARTGDLVVYVSGARAAYRRIVPILEGFSRAHYFVGRFGAGSKMKFVANLLVAIHNVAAAEALVLARRAGLDLATTLEAVSSGAGSSRMLQVRGPMMIRRDYAKATMKLDVWQKDMTIIAEFARQVGCPTPLFSASAPLYSAALSMGRGDEDTAAVHAVLEEMAARRL